MGRIRSVKPELHSTQCVASLSDIAFRVLIGLYSLVDDEGRAPADVAYVTGQLFWAAPREPGEVAAALLDLEHADLIATYVVAGIRYLAIVGWRDPDAVTYQRIDKPQRPKYPAPP